MDPERIKEQIAREQAELISALDTFKKEIAFREGRISALQELIQPIDPLSSQPEATAVTAVAEAANQVDPDQLPAGSGSR